MYYFAHGAFAPGGRIGLIRSGWIANRIQLAHLLSSSEVLPSVPRISDPVALTEIGSNSFIPCRAVSDNINKFSQFYSSFHTRHTGVTWNLSNIRIINSNRWMYYVQAIILFWYGALLVYFSIIFLHCWTAIRISVVVL